MKKLLIALFCTMFSLTTSTVSYADEDTPVVGTLKTRDYLISIVASAKGPLYSVSSHNGKVLEENLDEFELSSAYPELAKMIQRGFAADDASLAPELESAFNPEDL